MEGPAPTGRRACSTNSWWLMIHPDGLSRESGKRGGVIRMRGEHVVSEGRWRWYQQANGAGVLHRAAAAQVSRRAQKERTEQESRKAKSLYIHAELGKYLTGRKRLQVKAAWLLIFGIAKSSQELFPRYTEKERQLTHPGGGGDCVRAAFQQPELQRVHMGPCYCPGPGHSPARTARNKLHAPPAEALGVVRVAYGVAAKNLVARALRHVQAATVKPPLLNRGSVLPTPNMNLVPGWCAVDPKNAFFV